MKKMTSLLSAGLLSIAAFAAAEGNPAYYNPNSNTTYPNPDSHIQWMINYDEAVSLAKSSSKPIAILFTGTGWCPACVKLERDVLANPEFTYAVSQKFIFLKAEFPDYTEQAMMNSPYKALMDKYGVNAFPTIIVISAAGEKLYTVNYRVGGAKVYANELLQGLNTSNR